ncbi:3-deoxy-D-manno-octulosonic-acid transferase [Ectothiorhodospira mobilis]|uniref:3-deoxy-D-manno-octulosonic acid transferase n=1 Tax=Ectothiorhodospira mobilis TaxID=195064 RepID=A0A1I4R932_ECTMO|nr:lipid IV(A) 3-deoxy-D-manno-octulosonic acid transferase [Ectothiorhodospira mobilis]SFM48757.1 3-deoxy-D-manno-octulosonic-acid transferase [Ectothiorhodospira mobilis]
MAAAILRGGYTWLLRLLLPVLLLRLLWRGRRQPAYRRRLGERLGFAPRLEPRARRLWVHAVSVGEVIAAVPLIRAWQARFPGEAVLVTTTTPTGMEEVARRLGGEVDHRYLPLDLPGAMARFIKRCPAQRLLVMETELWPNLYRACRRRGVPVMLVNARLSARSLRGYARLRPLLRATLADTALIAAREAEDARRFLALGAAPGRVQVVGNLKYDLGLSAAVRQAARDLRRALGVRPVWIAASTHEGEEARLLQAHAGLRQRRPDALLILVPRHPERFDAVARLCQGAGLPMVRRSAGGLPGAEAAVWLGDTMGELLTLCGAADVAFMGGSLVPVGGHNPLEPAAHGVPVITGPHVFNFEAVYADLEAAGGVLRLADAGELAGALAALLGDAAAREGLAAGAARVLKANRGAVDRLVDRAAAL